MYPSSSISFSASRTLNTYYMYRITNGLCKKAIAVELDAGFTAIETLNNKVQDNELSDLDNKQENIIPFNIS
ncbi:26397_t:CDS:2 [Gigaspora margarita]|uniref:26397_t:CDS:1 n=1 Tax=Gigaspora margarita TaxID=4874 RepID=A0ABN7VC00_GIGMA|nr:26397_t:CDS:2 [Gigaspora margarita]